MTKVCLDQRQTHINAGCDTGRSPYLAILDKQRISIDLYCRVKFLQAICPPPMGGHTAAIQLPRSGQQKGSSTYRAKSSHGRGVSADPAHQFGTSGVFLAVTTTCADNCIDIRSVKRGNGFCVDSQAGTGSHTAAQSGYDYGLVQYAATRALADTVRCSKRLQWPGQVEQIHAVIG